MPEDPHGSGYPQAVDERRAVSAVDPGEPKCQSARPCVKFVRDHSVIRAAFVASALEAREEVARYGQVMEAVDVRKWLLARAGDGKAARPRPRKLLK